MVQHWYERIGQIACLCPFSKQVLWQTVVKQEHSERYEGNFEASVSILTHINVVGLSWTIVFCCWAVCCGH